MRMRRQPVEIVVLAILLVASCGGRPAAPAPETLNILVSNDDGIEAPGILALAEALRSLGTVTVAAPDANRTGASHGVTSDRPIAVRSSDRDGVKWFAIDALPATCVRLALEKLLPSKPDIVVSGINKGENLGTVTFYSATVGAAREAAFLGVQAMAVNLVADHGMDFEAAAAVTARIVRALGRDGVPRGTFLNVNIPPVPREGVRGLRLTRQDTRAPIDFFDLLSSAEGVTEYRPGWVHLEPAGAETDIWAVRNGYVSVSVFGFDQSAAAPPAASLALKRLESLEFVETP
ncbi:MAG TPA: 5'/3'-nucleotidase SurE [Candidatus Aminicenantes bacterium]|nr:5'/3'-nucleotidase SurE [Candidatus Aminicenantes bacterium]